MTANELLTNELNDNSVDKKKFTISTSGKLLIGITGKFLSFIGDTRVCYVTNKFPFTRSY